MAPLSPAQRRVLEAGIAQQKALGGAVTLRDLSATTGAAVSTLHVHIRALINHGVAKKSERGPGFVFRRPLSETSARLAEACKRLGLDFHQTSEIVRAGGGW